MSFNYDVISDLLIEGCSLYDILEAYGLQDERWDMRWRRFQPKIEVKPDPLSEVSFF